MNKKQKFEKSIKHIQLDQDGFIVGIKGRCKASDFYDDDVFIELGIKRMN